MYVVYREHLNSVEFLDKNTGGWFKGRDPSVPIDRLKARWIDEAHVLYIGKADAGRAGARGIRVRLASTSGSAKASQSAIGEVATCGSLPAPTSYSSVENRVLSRPMRRHGCSISSDMNTGPCRLPTSKTARVGRVHPRDSLGS